LHSASFLPVVAFLPNQIAGRVPEAFQVLTFDFVKFRSKRVKGRFVGLKARTLLVLPDVQLAIDRASSAMNV